MIYNLAIAFFASAATHATTVTYGFPQPETTIKYVCEETDLKGKVLRTMPKSIVFSKVKDLPKGLASSDSLFLHTVTDESGAVSLVFREAWQVPTFISTAQTNNSGGFKELILPEVKVPSTTWKVGERRVVRTVRLSLGREIPPPTKRKGASVYSHDIRILSQGTMNISTSKGPKTVKTYTSVDKVFGYKDNSSTSMEVIYSPDLHSPVKTTQKESNGGATVCRVDHYTYAEDVKKPAPPANVAPAAPAAPAPANDAKKSN